MRGGGGILSAVLDATAEETAAVVDRLRLFAIAPSLGGVENLVTRRSSPTTVASQASARSEASPTA